MAKFKMIVGFVFLICKLAYSQQLYVSDNEGRIFKVNLENCETELFLDGDNFRDIAFNTNGELLGVINRTIQNIDTITGNSSPVIHSFPTPINPIVGLTTKFNNEYIGGGRGKIYSYNPNEENSDTLLYDIGIGIAGDVSYRFNNIITSLINDKVIMINPKDSSIIREYNFGQFDGAINGLSTVWYNCELQTYATITTQEGSEVYELNFESEEAVLNCSLDFVAFGSAFLEEYKSSLDSIQLNALCDSTITKTYNYENTNLKVYPNPFRSTVSISSNSEHCYLYSLRGQLLRKIQESTTIIDLSDFGEGIYYIRIDDELVKIIKI